jgi:predicted RNA-binding Zn-ribbon protein involved in translation (DUF1610 family)
MKVIMCPQCGHFSIQERDHCIQEVDPVVPAFQTAKILVEFECEECGWLAASAGTAV